MESSTHVKPRRDHCRYIWLPHQNLSEPERSEGSDRSEQNPPESAEAHGEAAVSLGADVVGEAGQVVGRHLTGAGPLTAQPEPAAAQRVSRRVQGQRSASADLHGVSAACQQT